MHLPDQQADLGGELLQLARGSIEHGFVHNQPLPIRFDELPLELSDLAATFTTLRIEEKLRGCVGNLEARRPLAEAPSFFPK